MATTTTHKLFDSPINCALQTRTRLISGTSIVLFDAVNSVYKLRRIGKGMFVHSNTFVQISDGDSSTGAVFDLEITDGTTTKAIISGSTAAQAGGGARPSKAASVEPGCSWVTPSGAYWVQIRCTTAASGTAAAVDVTTTLVVSGETENSGTLVE